MRAWPGQPGTAVCADGRHHASDACSPRGVCSAALAAATEAGVTGAAVTPFVLARVAELTAGASLASNIALVKNNAAVGAQIAGALAAARGAKKCGEERE